MKQQTSIFNYSLKNTKISLIFLLFHLLWVPFISGQSSFYNIQQIQTIEIQFPYSNWDYILDTAKLGNNEYTVAQSVTINGVTKLQPGIRFKGNSSYDSTFSKNPFHIKLDFIIDQNYEGHKDIKLSNCYADPSMIREVLAYKILNNYMESGRANFAELFINGEYIGLFTNTEDVNNPYCLSRFFSSDNTFIKCNPVINPGPANKSNLRYLSSDSSAYFNYYEIKSDNGWNELVELCNQVTNYPGNIQNIFHVDKVLWMLAFNNVLVNLDSYSGAFVQNYYIYRDQENLYNPIVWDLNMAFGGFPYLGNGASSMASLSVTDMQQMPVFIHTSDPYWPLIKAVMANNSWKKMYVAHMKTMMDDWFFNDAYTSLAGQLMEIAEPFVLADDNKFFSSNCFYNALDSQYIQGSYFIPGIRQLMNVRIQYLQSTNEFIALSPSISNVYVTDTLPEYGTTITICATISNATQTWLNHRVNVYGTFQKTEMNDSGINGDITAGDGIWSAQLQVQSAFIQYYIYAENNNAGLFYPERAAHEFLTLKTDLTVIQPGDLVINEFMADNTSYEQNDYWEYTDWIELKNNKNHPLDLTGCYISDKLNRPLKYMFPAGTLISSQDYVLLWADNEVSSPSYLHCNFSLDTDGDKLILCDPFGNILDSVSFGFQYPNESTGRCPDGTGPFVPLYVPSILGVNCVTGIESTENTSVRIFPNPADNELMVEFSKLPDQVTCEIFSPDGRLIQANFAHSKLNVIDLSACPSGLYLLVVWNNEQRFFSTRFIKL